MHLVTLFSLVEQKGRLFLIATTNNRTNNQINRIKLCWSSVKKTEKFIKDFQVVHFLNGEG